MRGAPWLERSAREATTGGQSPPREKAIVRLRQPLEQAPRGTALGSSAVRAMEATAAVPSTKSDQEDLWSLEWRSWAGGEAAQDGELMAACAALYSAHYGDWGPRGRRPGERVQMSEARIRALVTDQDARLACAYLDGELVGYCIALRTQIPDRGSLAWVTQLVVHRDHRNARIATRLLYGMWHFSDTYAAGLATANPFAIRALETATRRRCVASVITSRGEEVLKQLGRHDTYLPDRLVRNKDGRIRPRVNTEFYVDHSGVQSLQKLAARKDRPWALGSLDEGEEWFGCTFNVQPPHPLDDNRLNELLTGADEIWILAYEGMTLDEDHAWHRHAKSEVAQILELTGLQAPATILDVGCGDGRHVREFAARGFTALGIDIAPRLVSRGLTTRTDGTQFEVADARKTIPQGPFDLVTCLYDVIGSSAQADDDLVLTQNMARVLRPGGYLVATVMNTFVTLDVLKDEQRPSSNQELVSALEKLRPSRTMEKSGNVFDPSLLLHYRGVYYRKEQFEEATWRLPVELVVRDRRFTPEMLQTLLGAVGLEMLLVRPVRAGAWGDEPPLEAHDSRAKEYLVVARRPK